MENSSRRQTFILVMTATAMFAVYSLFAWFIPVSIDDYAFMRYYLEANGGDPDFSWSGLTGYFSTVWNVENGRLANYLCAPVLLWIPHWLRALLLGLVISSTFILSARLASSKERLTPAMLVFVWALMAMFLPWRDISSLMVADYALNYFLSGLFLLMTLTAAVRLDDSKMGQGFYIAALIAAFCAGLCHECFGLPLISAMAIVALLNRFSMPVRWWGLFAAVVAGTAFCLSSPAIWSRLFSRADSLNLNIVQACRLLAYSGFIFSMVCFILFCGFFTIRGRRWLKQIFSVTVNRYFGLLGVFSAIIAEVLSVEGRGFFLADLSAVVILANILCSTLRRIHFAAVISVATLLLLFYVEVIRWQIAVYYEDKDIKEALEESEGEAVYYDVMLDTPWWTLRHPTAGLWRRSSLAVMYSNYIHREADSLAIVLPTVLRGIDFNNCEPVPGLDEFKQAGDVVLVPSYPDKDLRVWDMRVTTDEGDQGGTWVGYEYVKNIDGTLWCMGTPLKRGLHGPYRFVKRPD